MRVPTNYVLITNQKLQDGDFYWNDVEKMWQVVEKHDVGCVWPNIARLPQMTTVFATELLKRLSVSEVEWVLDVMDRTCKYCRDRFNPCYCMNDD